jgi:cyclic pyranopterin phosphate synthase
MLDRLQIGTADPNALQDGLGRQLSDLRLSVIDRCNFRCSYCMPAESVRGKQPFLESRELLSDKQLLRIVRVFNALGARKVRLTGGEPLLRPGFTGLVCKIARLPAVSDLSMTTNGILLPRLAAGLKAAGLDRITVSLDSLDEEVFARMSGARGSVAEVLEGIRAAEAAGFERLKINCVVHKGVNDHTVMDLVEHFRGSGHVLRLIEFLDVGSSNQWSRDQVVPGDVWHRRIHQRWPLKPLGRLAPGETAERYAFVDGQGEIGLINSITRPFCGACSRARVTADGTLHTCLFAGDGISLQAALDRKDDDRALQSLIGDCWSRRSDRYSELRHLYPSAGRSPEMYRMGG